MAEMSNVVSISGDRVPQAGEPNPRLVESLEDLLERARSGEVQGVAYAALDRDNLAHWCCGGLVGCYSVLGALTCLTNRVRQVCEDDK
jgi:hypothetical protein